jgi:pectate lyase
MSKLAICQTGYPKIVVFENDTVVALTRAQMKKINNLHLHYNECKETKALLEGTLDSCKVIFAIYDSMLINLKDQRNTLEEGAKESKKVITEMVKMDEKKNRKIRNLTLQNKLLKAGGILVLAAAAIMMII